MPTYDNAWLRAREQSPATVTDSIMHTPEEQTRRTRLAETGTFDPKSGGYVEPASADPLAEAKAFLAGSTDYQPMLEGVKGIDALANRPKPSLGKEITEGLGWAALPLSLASLVPSPVQPFAAAATALTGGLSGARKMLAPEGDESRMGGAIEAGLNLVPGAMALRGRPDAVVKGMSAASKQSTPWLRKANSVTDISHETQIPQRVMDEKAAALRAAWKPSVTDILPDSTPPGGYLNQMMQREAQGGEQLSKVGTAGNSLRDFVFGWSPNEADIAQAAAKPFQRATSVMGAPGPRVFPMGPSSLSAAERAGFPQVEADRILASPAAQMEEAIANLGRSPAGPRMRPANPVPEGNVQNLNDMLSNTPRTPPSLEGLMPKAAQTIDGNPLPEAWQGLPKDSDLVDDVLRGQKRRRTRKSRARKP